MRRSVLVATAVILLSTAACRSGVDLSTARGQLKFGVQAAKMDLWREAQFRFLRAVEMNPDDLMAYNNLAVAYEGIGEFEKAREAYLRALQIDRSNQYVQRNYSRFVEFYSKKESQEKESARGKEKPAAETDTEAGSGNDPVPSDPALPDPALPDDPSAPAEDDEPEVQEPEDPADESLPEETVR